MELEIGKPIYFSSTTDNSEIIRNILISQGNKMAGGLDKDFINKQFKENIHGFITLDRNPSSKNGESKYELKQIEFLRYSEGKPQEYYEKMNEAMKKSDEDSMKRCQGQNCKSNNVTPKL